MCIHIQTHVNNRDACQHIVTNGEGLCLTKEPEEMELKNEIDSLYSRCLQKLRKHIVPFGSYIQDLYQQKKQSTVSLLRACHLLRQSADLNTFLSHFSV